MNNRFESLAAVVLAGGQGSRMDGLDKGLVPFRNQPMCSWTLERLKPLVSERVISCNRNQIVYQKFGVPVISDSVQGFVGPLAGVEAAMAYLKGRHSHLLVMPCDTPLVHIELVENLIQAAQLKPDAVTLLQSDGRLQCLHAIIPLAYHQPLMAALAEGQRAVYRFYKRFPVNVVDVEDGSTSLVNLNTLEQLALSA